MEDPSAEVRQYGGGYGGFVECCEGVVDPLFLLLIIAGVTPGSVWRWIQNVSIYLHIYL